MRLPSVLFGNQTNLPRTGAMSHRRAVRDGHTGSVAVVQSRGIGCREALLACLASAVLVEWLVLVLTDHGLSAEPSTGGLLAGLASLFVPECQDP
jgi:hypothetical protein